MPTVLPFQVPEKVPKRARKRIGKLMVVILDKLMGLMPCAEAEPVEEVSETALLCTNAYSLIARRSLDDCPGEKGMPGRETKQWKTLRRRMQLAEAGNWQTLVKEALADAAEARDQIDTERFVGQAEQDPAEEER